MSLLHKKSLSVLYLDRTSFTYFLDRGQSYVFQFPQGTVNELEIINEELFEKTLITFIQSQKLPPATVMIILSPDIIYEKEFLDPAPPEPIAEEKKNADKKLEIKKEVQTSESRSVILEERARQIQIFLETVPFEEIASKNYKLPKGVKVIASNKHFYETIISMLTKQLFIIDAVVPFTMLDKEIIAAPGMNAEKAKKIIKHYELIKHNSMMEENRLSFDRTIPEMHHIQMTTKITTKREIALVSIFGCLLLVLGVLSYTTFFSSSRNRRVASLEQTIPITPVIPTVPPSPTPVASESAAINKESMKVLINGGTALQQNLIKQDFLNNGFTNIITKPSTVPATGKALVIFSSNLSSQAKEVLLALIKQNVLNVSVQETSTAEADVVINL